MDLRANTAIEVPIGPAIAVGDGFTPVTTLTIAGADEAELIKHGATTSAGLAGTLAAYTAVVDGHYHLDLSTGETDTEGQLVIVIQDDSLILPIRNTFRVLSEAAYDSLYAPKDAGFMDINIKTVGRADTQETEADNLETACANFSVTRGLTGTSLPAVVAGLAGGVPTDTDANGAVRIVDGTGARELNTNAGAVANVDTLAGHTAQTGDSFAIVNSGTFGNAQLVRSTTPANALDVSAGGEAGLDWANIGSPTTAQNLSGTNIDVDQIVASVSGNVDGSVGSVTGGATSAEQTTAQNDLDIITGSDGVVIAGAQPNHIIFDDGIVVNTTTAARSGLELNGNTSGAGLKATGGATGDGITGTGGASGGSGLNAESLTGAGGIRAASSGGGAGMNVSSTTGVGMVISAGGSSDGLQVNGGGATNDIVGDLQGNVTGSVGSNLELGPSEVNFEVLDVLTVDTFAEPAQGAPLATTTILDKLGHLFKGYRNRKTATATQISIFNDDTTTIDHKRTISDNGTTYDEEEIISGP